jgi:hypothetical protein
MNGPGCGPRSWIRYGNLLCGIQVVTEHLKAKGHLK